MINLQQILETNGIRRALVVDDAYDDVPRASDLSMDGENWRQFFEDLNDGDRTHLRAIYDRYDATRADELRVHNDFVAALWRNRERLRADLIGALFERYSRDRETDIGYLATLTEQLRAFGLACETSGRDFSARAADCDLIVIDLYLGSTQDEEALATTIAGLHRAITARTERPPLVILMSRSSRLEEKRVEFRDRSGLFESTFRIIRKAELGEAGALSRLLGRLAGHYPDSLKLAAFLVAWRRGVGNACERTARSIQTLDIGEHAHIQRLLLDEEGAPLGSYLVDVFDRVLQHEVEREGAIIDAAIRLSEFRGANYPPPYVAGSPDLQLLVFRTIFQNPERLRLISSVDSRVGFGDILRRKNALPDPPPDPRARLNAVGLGDILVVLTPSCDLQRGQAMGILLLIGSLMALQPEHWVYDDRLVRTPIIQLANGDRFWIKWNLKNMVTLSSAELDVFLDAPTGFARIACFRESYALELQQRLLASLGRVGVLSPMPGTFPVSVEVYLPDGERKLFRLEGPGLASIWGVCFIGRKKEKDLKDHLRLVLCEDDCEAICRALHALDRERLHAEARPAIETLLAGADLPFVLERGVVLPGFAQVDFREIEIAIEGAEGAPQAKATIGFVRWGEGITGHVLKSAEVRKGGLSFVVKVSGAVLPEAV